MTKRSIKWLKSLSHGRRMAVLALIALTLTLTLPQATGQTPSGVRVTTQAAKSTKPRTSTATPTKGPASTPSSSKAKNNNQPKSASASTKKPLPRIAPQIPHANRYNKQQVFLEHADLMYKTDIDSFIIVTGNVEFSHGPTLMYCDSAHFYPGSESLDAFGNVRMRQGDTLFIYADELNYSGSRHMAYLYGTDEQRVRMINRDVTLLTPTFVYDLASDFGWYNEGGELTDKKNRLVSREGEYIPATKEASFFRDVVMTSRTPGDTIYTDTLYYNTGTHIAMLESPSTIINEQGVITTTSGTYDTNTSIANLYNRSLVVASTGATLEGDTLYYDRKLGYGEAFGNMVLNDTAHKVILTGDYGYYNELIDSAFATGRALARDYSQGDTLYLHGTYLYGYAVYDSIHHAEDTITATAAYTTIDTTYVMIAHPRVRFYRDDMQGVCDSMRFEQRDTMLYMYHHPIVWSDGRQIFGNIIQVHFNDSTIDKATLPDYGLSAEHIEDKYFNQLAGKEMIAYFRDGEMYKLDVNGNVEAIMLPQEEDSTYNKIVNVESSFLTALFAKQKILKAKMWPETNGTVTPLYLAKKGLFYLPKFKWYTDIKPESPEDVMIIPEAMEALMADIPASTIIPRRRVTEDGEIVTYDITNETQVPSTPIIPTEPIEEPVVPTEPIDEPIVPTEPIDEPVEPAV